MKKTRDGGGQSGAVNYAGKYVLVNKRSGFGYSKSWIDSLADVKGFASKRHSGQTN
jgi:hypothetical protein